MPSPVRRIVYRYRRWQYHREMALPTPTSPRPHRRHSVRRLVGTVTHPRASVSRAYERRVEARPVPPPRTEKDLAGGRIHRTYVHTRIRWSRFWRGIPNWPVTFQVVALALVGVIIGVGALGIYHATKSKPAKPDLLAVLGEAGTFYSDQNANTKPHVARVFVAGDFSLYIAALQVGNSYTQGGIHAVGATTRGCGINDADTMVGTKRVAHDAGCSTWPADYAAEVGQFKPHVSVLMTGRLEQFDQIVNGKRLTAGSAAWRAYLTGQLDKARAALTRTGAKLILVNLPCNQAPAGNLLRSNLDALWASYAKAHAPDVQVGDLSGLTCPGGKIASNAAGKPLLDPSDSLTLEGISAFWHWLPSITKPLAGRV